MRLMSILILRMRMTNQEAFREFVRGMAFVFLVLIVLLAIVLALGKPNDKPQPENRFKVVDQYGPCEVVRYTPKGEAKFVYFLDCK